MLKVAPSVLLAALAVAAAGGAALCLTGCQEQPPDPPSAGQAVKSYQAHLAETCAPKHKENLSADKLNDLSKEFYKGLDLNSRQRVDHLTLASCAAAGASNPDCYNTGFLSAVENIGEINHFAVFVCAAPNPE